MVNQDQIQSYYDAHVMGKLRGFVEGNDRVECAWSTIEAWAGECPRRILEIGCGIGDISWRLSRQWPESQVVGLDVSPRSLELAQTLFGNERLSFCEGPLVAGRVSGPFDLVVLMDVYEHIHQDDRPELHLAIRALMSEHARVVLAFPTPRHLAWLKIHQPDRIQPVDEDITPDTISALARATGTEVLCYKEVDVWHEGDYAHAVLGHRVGWKEVQKPAEVPDGTMRKLKNLFGPRPPSFIPPRQERLARVLDRLGPGSYTG